jgi:hypothetical protein
VSGVQVRIDYDDREDARRQLVLAVSCLWGDVECRAAANRAAWYPAVAVSVGELERELEELIAALDRRVPRVEHAGEGAIARDAAVLRAKAVDRLKELARDTGVLPAKRRST